MAITIGGKIPSTITIDGQLVYSTLTEPLNATQNGTYTPTSPNIGFSEVTVNVPASAVDTGTKQITTNGTHDVIGYASVDVNVQEEIDYLYIETLEDGRIQASNQGTNATTTKPVIYYSRDKVNWTLWDFSDIPVLAGEKVYFYGDNPRGIGRPPVSNSQVYNYTNILVRQPTGYAMAYVNIGGNVMTLLERTGKLKVVPPCAFGRLFQSTYTYTMPKMDVEAVLSYGCWRMFYSCKLTENPVLKSPIIESGSYGYMFNGCTSIEEAEIDAYSSAAYAVEGMFNGCSNLKKITTYTDSWSNSYSNNFSAGVAATGDFYNLGGATIPTGTNGIPTGWTEHTSL